MAHPKTIIFTFASFRKTAKAFIFPVGDKIVAAAGKDLMAISLVTNVPYQLIVRRIVNVMKCGSQFDDAKAGPKMPAMNADYIYNILAKFITNLVEFFSWQLLQVVG